MKASIEHRSIEPINLRERDIQPRYRVSPSWFRELVAAKILPQPQRLGPRVTVWSRASLDKAFADPELSNRIAAYIERRREERKGRKVA